MTKPVRLRLSRAKGFDLQLLSRTTNGLPAKKVTRPGRWGNPFTKEAVINWHLGDYMGDRLAIWREEATEIFRVWVSGREPAEYWKHPFYGVKLCDWDCSPLRGHNLACWCPLPEPGQPDHCHAAVLLEVANG
jgi:hypothetical protein